MTSFRMLILLFFEQLPESTTVAGAASVVDAEKWYSPARVILISETDGIVEARGWSSVDTDQQRRQGPGKTCVVLILKS